MAIKIIILFYFIIIINKVYMNNFILTGHFSYIYSIIYLKDGKLASASEDKTIRIWDTTNGNLIMKLEGHLLGINSLTLLNNGYLASGSLDKTILIWDTTIGYLIGNLTGHSSWVTSLSALSDGCLISCICIYSKTFLCGMQ